MKNIINLTPHDVILYHGENRENRVCFEASGLVARLETQTETIGEINGVPIVKTTFGKVYNLPEFQDGTYYIVSALVKGAMPDRTDLLVPSGAIRDSHGRIVAAKALGM